MNDLFLNTAIQAVENSGHILIDYFGKLHDSRQKNENFRDLVTEVDLLVEESIRERISSDFPSHSIIGEEKGTEHHGSEYCWHIDPVDGTVNYSQGIPLCAISVGLEYKGEVIVGVVFNPFTEELFFASKGNGAFLNGKNIHVSNKKSIKEGLFVAAFSSETADEKIKEYQVFGEINDASRGVLRFGSAALSLAYLACGRIDGFWTKDLKSWDLAGGIVLVNEAGGSCTNIANKNYRFDSEVLVSSNSLVHALLLKQLNGLV